MKLEDARISILIGADVTRIELKDSKSNISFCRIELSPQQLSQALSRTMYVPCEMELVGLDRIGKTMEHTDFTFEITDIAYDKRSGEFQEYAKNITPDGWTPDLYFGSQSSFFSKDGKDYARMIIRRWV